MSGTLVMVNWEASQSILISSFYKAQVSWSAINSEKKSKGIVCNPGLPLHLRVKMRCFTTFSVAGYVSNKPFSVEYQCRVLTEGYSQTSWNIFTVYLLKIFHFFVYKYNEVLNNTVKDFQNISWCLCTIAFWRLKI